jgi:hypothetical protein
MPTQLGGYEETDTSKASALREVTTTNRTDGSKAALDVNVIGGNHEVDLVNNPAWAWTITRSDGQPDTETITFDNGDVYDRTFTYNVSGFLTLRSKWVKQ